jgi:hypothetical protein
MACWHTVCILLGMNQSHHKHFLIFFGLITFLTILIWFPTSVTWAKQTNHRRDKYSSSNNETDCYASGGCWDDDGCYQCGDELDVQEASDSSESTTHTTERQDTGTRTGNHGGGNSGSDDSSTDGENTKLKDDVADQQEETDNCNEVLAEMVEITSYGSNGEKETSNYFSDCGDRSPKALGKACTTFANCMGKDNADMTACFKESVCQCYTDMADTTSASARDLNQASPVAMGVRLLQGAGLVKPSSNLADTLTGTGDILSRSQRYDVQANECAENATARYYRNACDIIPLRSTDETTESHGITYAFHTDYCVDGSERSEACEQASKTSDTSGECWLYVMGADGTVLDKDFVTDADANNDGKKDTVFGDQINQRLNKRSK